MTFNDCKLSLKLLSLLNNHIINNSNPTSFISILTSIQKRMIDLFLCNNPNISSLNHTYGHKCIVYNLDDIISIFGVFVKHRLYNQPLMNLFSQQIIANILKQNPKHSKSINYFLW